jgi:hypothetical protein
VIELRRKDLVGKKRGAPSADEPQLVDVLDIHQ